MQENITEKSHMLWAQGRHVGIASRENEEDAKHTEKSQHQLLRLCLCLVGERSRDGLPQARSSGSTAGTVAGSRPSQMQTHRPAAVLAGELCIREYK